MTQQHIIYIPTIFLLGFLCGAITIEQKNRREIAILKKRALKNTLSGKSVLLSFLLFITVFIITHAFEIPYSSKAVKSALGGQEIFDKQPAFTGAKVYERLQAFSSTGLDDYKVFTYTIDLIFPLSLFYFLFMLAKFVNERRKVARPIVRSLTSLSILWLASDLIENTITFIILSQFPNQITPLASILGFVTLTKFGLLILSVILPLAFFIFFEKKNLISH